ncbi:MAG: two-component sensor histidine kinase [Anaerocolumna sp.]|jgi:signal transduction histidine kinase|nr:two-component sensor histidine kinase [Anaerocolumna sp.]
MGDRVQMELKKLKPNTLFWFFLGRMINISVFILIEIILYVVLFNLGVNSKIILPANYSEHYLEQNKKVLADSKPFDETHIPHTCKYGLFDLEGNYISGNFKESIITSAKDFLKGNDTSRHFFLIERDKEYLVVNYDVSAHFSSKSLNKIIPKLELWILISFIFIFTLIVVHSALQFGKKLKKELEPLLNEIELIQEKELILERRYSKIKELDDILLSLFNMKAALSNSLRMEWETEQKRKSNISAIAHDIKTPLTIIKGNAELIKEENKMDDIYQLADSINNNSDKIERYIRLLIDETNNKLINECEENLNLSSMVTDIITESKNLGKNFDIELITNNKNLEMEVSANKDLIERAVLNLVKNAIEHTNTNKQIKLSFEYKEHNFTVTIEDFGKGFTKEALKYGKNQFFTERMERSGEHYGLGLYFANCVAEKYNGHIVIRNKPNGSGAVVIFEIMLPVKE